MQEPIIIEDARLVGRRTIENKLNIPQELRPYFIEPRFFAEYSREIDDVPLSVLNIPALSSVIHFAWAIGYDVQLGEIDETYIHNLVKARRRHRSAPGFESLSFLTRILLGKVVKSRFNNMGKYGLLFSGGCDSTASYIHRRHLDPQLIRIWGLDIPLNWETFWNDSIKLFHEDYPTAPLLTVRTNSEEMYERNKLWTLGTKVVEGYRPGYSYRVNTLGLAAPLAAQSMGALMLGSTYPSREYGDPDYPWSNRRPDLDQFYGFADVKCYQVEAEYSTLEKIIYIIKPYFDETRPRRLRSCGNRALLETRENKDLLNCCVCDKCQRVISMLIVARIDPRLCGFDVNEFIYRKMKDDLMGRKWNADYLRYHFREIKKWIPAEIEQDFNGSKAFLEWLRGYPI